MILVFHTDGTAMWQWKLPSDHPAQPHLLRLAWQVSENGRSDEVASSTSLLIKPPPGMTVAEDARAFHDISAEDAEANGMDLGYALDAFAAALAEAKSVVAYNLPFHQKMLNRAAAQLGRPLEWIAVGQCAMKLAAPIVQVKLQSNGQFAWPKMPVAYEYFAKEPLRLSQDPTDAGVEMVEAVRRIYEGCLQARVA